MSRVASVVCLTVAACATIGSGTLPLAAEQEAFWRRLQTLCGQAFEGRIAFASGSPGDTALATQRLVMHVRNCATDEIRIPFHVGSDRSRTWVFTRTSSGLRLKHDHRHEDGQPDGVTMYGGDTRDHGEPWRQSFPADSFTASLNPLFSTNVWTIDVQPGQSFGYELQRIGTNRRFRAEFDLTRRVPEPPPPWGAQ
jgi:hypothetical protein